MRKIVIVSVGFVLGSILCIWIAPGFWALPAAALLLIVSPILWHVYPNNLRRVISLLLLGLAIGSCWTVCYDHFYLDSARDYDGKTESATIELSEYTTCVNGSSSGTGKLKIDGKTYSVRFWLNEELNLHPGETITGSFRFRFAGGFDEDSPTYYQGKGIFLTAYADGAVEYSDSDVVPLRYFGAYARKHIIQKINECFPEDTAGFACALLLGDTSGLSYEDDAALKVGGIRHIIAVSGLHVSILLSFAYLIAQESQYRNIVLCLPLLLLFTAIAGFTPSIVRACIMQVLLIFSYSLNRDFDSPTALAIAVLLIMGVNPLVITSVSFQLSVGCVIGINLFNQKVHDVLMRTKLGPAKGKSLKSRIIRASVSSFSVTLGTMAVTLPVSAYHFGSVSIVSILTNLTTLWLVSFCFYGVLFSCVIGFIFPVAGSVIAWLISWVVRFILLIAKLFAKIPFASISVHNTYFLVWVVFAYILFAVFLFSKKKKPFLFSGLAILGLCISFVLAFAEPRLDQYRMTVLDVGQGQCILLQSKDDCYVVDCGGDSSSGAADLAAQTLRSNGIQKIDGLIVTHFDTDHAGGAERLLAQIEADNVYVPDADYENELHKSLKRNNSEELNYVCNTLVLDCGLGTVTIFPGEKGKEGNESSLYILFQVKDCDILITGDQNNSGERYLVDHEELPQLDILVAGHHGADSSTSLYLLQKTRPASVVFSVGENNGYGHPDPVILRRIERFDCTIWRTDQDGTIIFRG